jgi:hypothetical protein
MEVFQDTQHLLGAGETQEYQLLKPLYPVIIINIDIRILEGFLFLFSDY